MGLLATLVIVGYTLAPTGFYALCAEQPRQCEPVAARRPVGLSEIDAVNRRVNAAIRPQPEPPGQDIWKVGGASGDCEDYALAKRDALIAAGLGSANARLVVGILPSGEYHAVLIVSTRRGDFVLDNLTNELRPLGQQPATIISVQSARDPRLRQRVRH